MTKQTFQTHGVLSAATDILMGDIGALYDVGTFLLGRSIYTHELSFYGAGMRAALKAAVPGIPEGVTSENWQEARDAFIAWHGETMALPNELAGCLADGSDAISSLDAMLSAKGTPA